MDSYQKIEQLRKEVSRLQQELTALRTRKTKIQDASLRKILQKEITEMIETIDRSNKELANEKARLLEKSRKNMKKQVLPLADKLKLAKRSGIECTMDALNN